MIGQARHFLWLMGTCAAGLGLAWRLRPRWRRPTALAKLAGSLGLRFQAEAPGLEAGDYRRLHLFSQGRQRRYRNILCNRAEGSPGLVFCDYEYTSGDGRATRTWRQTVALLSHPRFELPRFELRPSDAQAGEPVFGYQEVAFPESPRFSSLYRLRGPDAGALRVLFGPDLRQHFESSPGWCLDGRGGWLAAYRQGRLVDAGAYPRFIEEARLLLRTFSAG